MSIGWIKLHREIQEHWIFTDPIKFKWWVQILMKVNHKEGEILLGNSVLKIQKGQSACSLRTWALTLNCSVKSVSTFFELLKSHNMIESKIIGKGKQSTTLITVSNYTEYQSDKETLNNTQSNTLSNTLGKHKGNTKGVQSKNEENDNNEKEDNKKDMSSKLDFDNLVVKYISWFNSTYDRKFNIDRFRNVCTSKLKALLKTYKNDIDAFKQDLNKVAKTVKNDSHHIETKYKYVTPEFLLRPIIFDKFLNTEENAGKKEPVHEYTYNFELGGTETNKFTHAEHLAYLERYKNAKLVYKSKSEVQRD